METAQDLDELCSRIEVAIFASGGPGFTARLRKLLSISQGQLDAVVEKINAALAERGRPYEIVSVAGGYQFRTRPEWGEFLAELQPERKQRLSPAALDTLAVIAYRQPITRAEIEDLRSVDCDGVLRSLIERRFVRVAGRRDAPGRPALYGTTPYFLEAFGMQALHELPPLRDLAEEAASHGSAMDPEGPPDAGGPAPAPSQDTGEDLSEGGGGEAAAAGAQELADPPGESGVAELPEPADAEEERGRTPEAPAEG